MKTAYLISCSDHYGHRLARMDAALKARGYKTQYITSDFDHTAKRSFVCAVENCVQLPVKQYHKNLSADRILSHWGFARDVYRFLKKQPARPDVIVALLPPNFLGYYMAKYKRENPDVRLVFDIFDLWPETFPSGRAKKLLWPVFRIWAWLRDRSLPYGDFVLTECDLFRQKLSLKKEKSETIYLSAPEVAVSEAGQLPQDRLELCYLGAINNVIGIDEICALIRQLTAQKSVKLHIIGKGERQELFVESAKAAGAQVEFHGAIFDEAQKRQILDRCHFGLNVMKDTVCVGLTMKSIDYFRFGLPIINSIGADTRALVEEYEAGVLLGEDCAKKLLALDQATCLRMRSNALRLFREKLSQDVINARYDAVLDRIL